MGGPGAAARRRVYLANTGVLRVRFWFEYAAHVASRAPGTAPIIFQTSPAMSHSDTIADKRRDTAGKGGNSALSPRTTPRLETASTYFLLRDYRLQLTPKYYFSLALSNSPVQPFNTRSLYRHFAVRRRLRTLEVYWRDTFSYWLFHSIWNSIQTRNGCLIAFSIGITWHFPLKYKNITHLS